MPSTEQFQINPNFTRPSFGTLVAAAKINGYETFTKFAASTLIPINTERDVWDSPTSLVYLTDEEFMNISSTDPDDTELGSGARTVLLLGLDINLGRISETIIMDGGGVVVSSKKYFRVYRMQVVTAGASASAEGTITATAAVSGTEQARIISSNNTTLMSHMTAPAGVVTVGKGFTVSVAAGKSAVFRLYIRRPGGVFVISDILAVTNPFQRIREFGLPTIEEGSDLKITAQPSDNNVICTASYDLTFIDNDLQGG